MRIFSLQTLLLIPILLMLASCHEDSIIESVSIDTFEPFEVYEIEIDGLISDRNGDPIADAQILFSQVVTTTDSRGYFDLASPVTASTERWLRVMASGFIESGRRVDVLGSRKVTIDMAMTAIPNLISFSADRSKEVTISDAVTIFFESNSLLRDGTQYDGQVNVVLAHLDPSSPEFLKALPGDLIGQDSNEELVVLESYGMLYASLMDDAMQPLELDQMKPALVKITIPESLTSRAPADIPLWSFDEERGVWIEEGEATKINNQYVGLVSHFSWWNVDDPLAEMITLCIRATDATKGDVLPYTDILFSVEGINFNLSRTNADGDVCINVPSDLEISAALYTTCTQPSMSIGSFTDDQDNVTVSLERDENQVYRISGIAKDCDEELLNASFGIFRKGRERIQFSLGADGSFDFEVNCVSNGDLLEVKVVDIDDARIASANITVQAGSSESNLNLTACENPSNIFIIETPMDTVLYDNIEVVVNPNETIFRFGDRSCYFSFLGNGVGTFEGAYFCGPGEIFDDIEVTITNFEGVIKGAFDGSQVSGTFIVINQ